MSDQGIPAPYVINCPAVVYTANGDDGYANAGSYTYTTAADMTSPLLYPSTTALYFGQRLFSSTYYCQQTFLRFDTNYPGQACDAAALSLWLTADYSDTDFTANVRIRSWGPTLDSGDVVPDHSLSALTLVASKSTTPTWSSSAYTDFTSEDPAFKNNVNMSGYTELILDSSRHEGNPGTAPTSLPEYMILFAADYGSQGPKLTLTLHTTPPTIDAAQVDDDIHVDWS